MDPVDYERAASCYDGRYTAGGPAGLDALVRTCCAESGYRPVLDVGCGTGHWTAMAAAPGRRAVGLDPSPAMLARARAQVPGADLVRGRAESLPFPGGTFGAVICVYVIHHLQDPARFVAEAARVLGGGGTLAVAAIAPHDGADDWYLYDYFDGMRDADRARYPKTSTVRSWMTAAGLADVRVEVAARITGDAVGAAVLDDPILTRDGTCQLSLLSDGEFEQGLARIRKEAREGASFRTDLRIFATTGRKA
jgi:ubiquinone/menaquinone biosynthesis C-methylase UbiE